MWGYDIHYNAGDKYYMIEEDVAKYVNTVEIQLRGDSNDDDVDVQDDSVQVDTNSSEDELLVDVIGGEDVEEELYLDDGVKPEWMI